MYSNAIDNSDEANKILRQLYDKAVQFTIPEDSRLVNPERVAAILVIPESCFPFSGYWIGGTEMVITTIITKVSSP
jgi:hypothetical protein